MERNNHDAGTDYPCLSTEYYGTYVTVMIQAESTHKHRMKKLEERKKRSKIEKW
jgi:hypothetical protein